MYWLKSLFLIFFLLFLYFIVHFFSQKPFPLTILPRKTWLILTILRTLCHLQFPIL